MANGGEDGGSSGITRVPSMASVGDLAGQGGGDPSRPDHGANSAEGKGKTPNPIKRFFTTVISRGTAGERAVKGSPPFHRSIPAKAMTGFLAHFANNLSHFSHGAEFFTDKEIFQYCFGDEDDIFGDEGYIFADLKNLRNGFRHLKYPRSYISVLRRVLASAKPMQEQMAKLSKTLKSLRESYGETSPAVKNIEDFLSRLEKLMDSQSKKIAEASEKGVVEEASAIRKLAEALKEAEESEVSALIKETDKFLKTTEIPLEMYERLKKAAAELKELKSILGGFVVSLGLFFRGYGFPPSPVNPASPVDPPAPNPVPCPFFKVGSGPTPFHMIGKRAQEVLFGDYEVRPFHGIGKADFLLCDKQLGLGVNMKSDPSVETTLSYGKVYDDDDYKMQARANFVLPLGDRSQAKFDLLHRRACLSASVGLSANPVFDVSGMIGIADGLCGGARLCFEAGGYVRDFDLGISMKTTEFGNVSACILNQKKLQILFDKAVGRATGAVELTYLHDPVPENRAVRLTGGLSYIYDTNLTLKGRVSSDLHVGGMIQFDQRLASIVLRATADVDLRAMGQPPRVGFQVVFDPSWK